MTDVWAEYQGYIGCAEEDGEGMYWFNTINRLIEDRKPFLLDKNDLKILSLEASKEDIKAMIDLALQTGDEEWFDELSEKLKSYKDKE